MVIILSKDEIINQAISKFREECAKIPNDKTFMEKLPLHEELIIKTVLETLLNNN